MAPNGVLHVFLFPYRMMTAMTTMTTMTMTTMRPMVRKVISFFLRICCTITLVSASSWVAAHQETKKKKKVISISHA